MADMVEMAMKLIKQQDKILKEGDSVTEALTMRVGAGCSTVLIVNISISTFQTNFGSSMTVTVNNFTKTALSAVRTSTTAGEVNKSSHFKPYFYLQ